MRFFENVDHFGVDQFSRYRTEKAAVFGVVAIIAEQVVAVVGYGGQR